MTFFNKKENKNFLFKLRFMSIVKNSNLKSNSIPSFFFFCGLYFLLVVGLWGGLLNCLNFLIILEKNYFFSALTKILFILLCFYHFINPKIGYFFLEALVSTKVFVNYCEKCLSFLQKKNQTNSFGVFVFFHLFLCLTFLHFFMILLSDVDLVIEYFYQIFNLIKLIFFPLFIYMYVIVYGPRFFKMEKIFDVINTALDTDKMEKITNFLKEFENSLKTNKKKYPKTTGLIIVGGLTLSSLQLYGHIQAEQMKAITNSTGFDIKSVDPQSIYVDKDLETLVRRFYDIDAKKHNSSLSISVEDILRTIKGDENLQITHRTLLRELIIANLKAQGKLEHDLNQAKLEAASKISHKMATDGSFAASPTISPSISHDQELPGPSSEIVSKSILDSKSQTCLEWSLIDFF